MDMPRLLTESPGDSGGTDGGGRFMCKSLCAKISQVNDRITERRRALKPNSELTAENQTG